MRSIDPHTSSRTLTAKPSWHEIELLLTKVLDRLLVWYQRSVERRELSRLTEFELRDIGRTRAEVAGEIGKPFWRP